jgi:hypothetical protein
VMTRRLVLTDLASSSKLKDGYFCKLLKER